MKKLLVLTLALVMTFAFGYVTLASTMGVNVSEGMSAYVEYYDQKDSGWGPGIGFNWGINDKVKVGLFYQFEGDDKEPSYNPETYSIDARYEIVDNLAATIKYKDKKDVGSYIILGLRAKKPLSDTFALTGRFEHEDFSADEKSGKTDGTSFTTTIGGEFYVTEAFALNTGLYFYSDDETPKGYTFGGEYNFEKICIYLDYDKDEGDEGLTTLGVSYSF